MVVLVVAMMAVVTPASADTAGEATGTMNIHNVIGGPVGNSMNSPDSVCRRTDTNLTKKSLTMATSKNIDADDSTTPTHEYEGPVVGTITFASSMVWEGPSYTFVNSTTTQPNGSCSSLDSTYAGGQTVYVVAEIQGQNVTTAGGSVQSVRCEVDNDSTGTYERYLGTQTHTFTDYTCITDDGSSGFNVNADADITVSSQQIVCTAIITVPCEYNATATFHGA